VRRALLSSCACLAALAAGCGNHRAKTPDVDEPLAPTGHVTADYPGAGLSFQAPRNWARSTGQAPLVATVTSGLATVAIWRYDRTEPLPRRPVDLKFARDELVNAAKTRDKTLSLQSSQILDVGGIHAVELLGDETIDGAPRHVRSTHLYDRAGKAEIVIDAYAPPERFDRVNRKVFAPLLASLKVGSAGSSRR
jgi:hypothetical protein